MVTCSICGQLFRLQSKFAQHMLAKHNLTTPPPAVQPDVTQSTAPSTSAPSVSIPTKGGTRKRGGKSLEVIVEVSSEDCEDDMEEKSTTCMYCGKVYSTDYVLKRHLSTCKHKQYKEQNATLKQDLDAMQEEVSKLRQMLAVKVNEVSMLQEKLGKLEKDHEVSVKVATLQEEKCNIALKLAEQTENSKVKNIQNNIQIVQNINSLTPVTNDGLRQLMFVAVERGLTFADATEHAMFMYESGLKDSIISTDKSRKVVKWRDGDNNNMIVKDHKAQILARKTYEASTEALPQLEQIVHEKIDKMRQHSVLQLHHVLKDQTTEVEETYSTTTTNASSMSASSLSALCEEDDGRVDDWMDHRPLGLEEQCDALLRYNNAMSYVQTMHSDRQKCVNEFGRRIANISSSIGSPSYSTVKALPSDGEFVASLSSGTGAALYEGEVVSVSECNAECNQCVQKRESAKAMGEIRAKALDGFIEKLLDCLLEDERRLLLSDGSSLGLYIRECILRTRKCRSIEYNNDTGDMECVIENDVGRNVVVTFNQMMRMVRTKSSNVIIQVETSCLESVIAPGHVSTFAGGVKKCVGNLVKNRYLWTRGGDEEYENEIEKML